MAKNHNKQNNISSIERKPSSFVQICFYILFFLTPLLLWPFTSEVFEFNKMIFVYLMTTIISVGWLAHCLFQKKIEIARTPLDLPILLFLGSQIISTIFSIDPHTSVWGYYSRFHGGLASTISYIILFYALVTHFAGQSKAIRNLIFAILSTAAITSVYAVLEKMGIDKHIWVQDVQNRVFSTLGQPNWLSAYLVAILPISLYKAVSDLNKDWRPTYSLLSLLFLTAIFFTKSQSGIGATMVILIIFGLITLIQKKKTKLLLLGIPLLIVVLLIKGDSLKRTLHSLNKINPFYSDTMTIVTEENKGRIGGSDSMTIRRVVWQGAIEISKKYPLFGTGVETFAYSYYWVRPPAHNLTSEADFLYNKAHNEYLNFLANTGFVGLITYLFLIFSIIRLFLRKPSPVIPAEAGIHQISSIQQVNVPLLLGFISILITNYFGFSVVNIGLFFFLFPAIFLAHKNDLKFIILHHSLNTVFGVALLVCFCYSTLSGICKMWLADLNYAAGRASLEENIQAIKLNPHEPVYYSQLGNIQALVAVQIIAPQLKEIEASGPAELKEEANFYLNQFVSDALSNTNKAVSLNPYNLNLLKTKARTELTLANLNPQYSSEAAKTLLKATELSPNEASNYYSLGVLYLSLSKQNSSESKDYLDLARKAFERAINLKSDYQAAKDQLSSLRLPALEGGTK